MKIYLVYFGSYDERRVVSAFSSKERVDEYMKRMRHEDSDEFQVEEIEMDKPMTEKVWFNVRIDRLVEPERVYYEIKPDYYEPSEEREYVYSKASWGITMSMYLKAVDVEEAENRAKEIYQKIWNAKFGLPGPLYVFWSPGRYYNVIYYPDTDEIVKDFNE